jgi:SAM-dependent methyltransferase
MASVLPENEEAQRAWDGVLFDRFIRFKHLIVTSLALHGAEAMRAFPPAEGDRVLDIGCGLGDTTLQLAELVGPDGSALGVDIAPRFIEAAEADARELGVVNARFEVADVQASAFADTFDYAFSRFGTMFFASPVAAMRNVHDALVPGGRLCSLVWRKREDNEWMFCAEQVVKPLVEIPEETDEARCGPGPFSLANADTVTTILQSAGFVDVGLHRRDLPLKIGTTLDEAIEFNLALGPAAEAVRLAGDEGDAMRPRLAGLLREALADLVTPAGVYGGSSVWIVTARRAD